MIAEQISLIEAANLQWQTLNDLGLNDNESKPVSALDECKTRYLIPHNTSLTLANEQLRFVGWLNLANRQIGFIELNQTTHIIEPKKLLNISNTTWQIDGWNAMELSLSPICNNGQ